MRAPRGRFEPRCNRCRLGRHFVAEVVQPERTEVVQIRRTEAASDQAVHAHHPSDRPREIRAERPVLKADQVPVAQFNRVLWTGLKGNTPYPALRGRLRNDLPPHLAWIQWR